MPINYKVSECVNPAGTAGTEYACDRETAAGTVTLDEIAEDVSHMTSMTKSDVMGILSAYIYLIYRWVASGIQCEVQGLGTFYPALKSTCFPQSAISAEGFDPSCKITAKRLRFRPNAALKKALQQQATYQRVSSELMA